MACALPGHVPERQKFLLHRRTNAKKESKGRSLGPAVRLWRGPLENLEEPKGGFCFVYIIYNFKGAPSADDIPLLPVEEPEKKGKTEKDIPGFFDRVDSTDTVTEPPLDDYLVLEQQT